MLYSLAVWEMSSLGCKRKRKKALRVLRVGKMRLLERKKHSDSIREAKNKVIFFHLQQDGMGSVSAVVAYVGNERALKCTESSRID